MMEQIDNISPAFFECLVVQLLIKMGYGGGINQAATVTGGPGDEGIDGVINEDKPGLDVIYIQAKHWSNQISRPELQKFVGALQGKRARKGVFITTSTFSQGARDYVKHLDIKVILIDGEMLARLMTEYNLGVAIKSVYKLKAVDRDFFEDAD